MVQGFRKHDYPWLTEGDPHKDKYQRWVPDMPDLSAAAHALLKAREKTLEEKNTVDIKELRSELAKLGIVVRDEETRQYWRWQQTEEGVE
jgi:cysteinyl-tRNA synthetase